jgi:lysophospholipase L1-like esterase
MKKPAAALACVLAVWGAWPSAHSGAAQTPTAAELERRLAAYRHLLNDWAGLTKYGSENAELRAPAPGEDRVVFLGDEITENWGRGEAKFFPGRPFINRGIAGQTTPQMLVRFRQDVVALKPKVVVIQGGTNDVARFAGPATRGTLGDNLMSMADIARVHGIRVVLASIPPVCDCGSDQSSIRPPMRIRDMNEWIKSYAAESGAIFLDYYAALADGRSLNRTLTTDGVLPNDAGYRVLAPLVEKAIAAALSSAR